MLDNEWSDAYAGYPASVWLLKAPAEKGLVAGYHVVT